MASWTELLTHPESGDHVAQLYGEDDQLLARNVSRYLMAGLQRDDGLLVVATLPHVRAIARLLGEEAGRATVEAERQGRLVFLDARETLDRLLVDGQPDQTLFDAVVGSALEDVRSRSASGKVRAFGEMVSLLWSEHRIAEAGILEACWNRLLAGSQHSLYCAYRIDLFGDDTNPADLNAIVGAHTHLFAGAGTVLSKARPVDSA